MNWDDLARPSFYVCEWSIYDGYSCRRGRFEIRERCKYAAERAACDVLSIERCGSQAVTYMLRRPNALESFLDRLKQPETAVY